MRRRHFYAVITFVVLLIYGIYFLWNDSRTLGIQGEKQTQGFNRNLFESISNKSSVRPSQPNFRISDSRRVISNVSFLNQKTAGASKNKLINLRKESSIIRNVVTFAQTSKSMQYWTAEKLRTITKSVPRALIAEDKFIFTEKSFVKENKPQPLTDITTKIHTATNIKKSTTMPSQDSLNTMNERFISTEIARLNIKLPVRIRRVVDPWQMVEDQREIYLLSAYFDDRPTLDRFKVVVIGIAEPGKDDLFCLLWYDSQIDPIVSHAEIIEIGVKYAPGGKTVYEQNLFSCDFTNGETNAPAKVSIVTLHNIRPSTLLVVNRPVKPKSDKDVIEFGHCMSVLFHKQDPYRVVEWMELHRIWGVGEVNIYGIELDKQTLTILDHYARLGFVRYQSMPNLIEYDGDESAILLNMSPVINDCMYRNMYRYRYIVCTDMDEFIVPRSHKTYSELIASIEATRAELSAGATVFRPALSYMFRNAYFFLDYGQVNEEPWFSTSLRYKHRVKPSTYGYSAKSITRSLACIGMQNHLCWRSTHMFNKSSDWHIDVDMKFALNQHYKKCHFDEYLGKNGICLQMLQNPFFDDSMERFRDDLMKKMITRLKLLDLVEEIKQ